MNRRKIWVDEDYYFWIKNKSKETGVKVVDLTKLMVSETQIPKVKDFKIKKSKRGKISVEDEIFSIF